MTDFRPDRLASLYLFGPLRMFRTRHRAGIPILMYHSISSQSEQRSSPYYRLCTEPTLFRLQMHWLFERGYSVLSLREAVRRLRDGPPLDCNQVAITFDDGYRDFYTNAWPVLQQFGYTATVFLPTAYIGDAPRRFQGRECLTWRDVNELRRQGIEFGSHTVTHPDLRHVGIRRLDEELFLSKREIEEQMGEAIESFSYPYAFPEADEAFIRLLRDAVTEAGYRHGVSTIIGRANHASHPLFLERLPVNSGDDLQLFEAKLKGDYDWLHAIQRASKVVRRRAA